MTLLVDVALEPTVAPTDPNTRVELDDILGAIRSPRRLARLLRDRHYVDVQARLGDLPPSFPQAIAIATLIIADADCWVLGGRPLSRTSFAARATMTVVLAAIRELSLSAAAATRVAAAARRELALPRYADRVARALYVRAEPSLRWAGVQVGGAATHTSGVVSGLVDNGVHVSIVACERPAGTEPATFLQARPTRVLQLVPGLQYADFAPAVIRAGSREPADFVYQRYQLGSYAGLELARRLGVPLVLEFNGSELWVERHWRSGRPRMARLLQHLEDRHLRSASLVTVVSEPLREHAIARGADPERVLVNPNGVDVDALAALRRHTPSYWRHRLRLPDRLTVGFVGTFGVWHGVELLPSIIEAVTAPPSHWLLIGGGGQLTDVREQIEMRGLAERVTLTGVVEHETALALLAATDVCISPHLPNPDSSQFFGSPTKLFEYMGLGKAIVAANLGQIGEVIQHERNGLLHPPGDATSAAAAVGRLLADPQLRTRLGAAAVEDARRSYSWSVHCGRVLEALQVGLQKRDSRLVR
jgi:glycosyltransferase involved in cell wall biosynthesis